MRLSTLASFLLPLAILAGGCAAESSDDPSTAPVTDPAVVADDSADDTDVQDLTAKPTFATTGALVAANCGGCHAQFNSLAGIKADKTAMIARINAGSMPKFNPTWKKSADGKKVLKWLKTGADLK
jgi:hypothetical protein